MVLCEAVQYDIAVRLQNGIYAAHGVVREDGTAPAADRGQRPYGTGRCVRPAVKNDAAATHHVVGCVEAVEAVGDAVAARVAFGYECMAERGEVAAVGVGEACVGRAAARLVAAAAVADGVGAQGAAGDEVPDDESAPTRVARVVDHYGHAVVVSSCAAVFAQGVGLAAPCLTEPHRAAARADGACPRPSVP